MTRKLYFPLIILSLFSACTSSEKKAEESTQDPTNSDKPDKSSDVVDCYQFAGATDTITLKLIHAGESITGILVYNLKEKDSNTGTIQGAMMENLLLADYTFMSEGMQSVRQIAFKKDGNEFIEGYGDIIMENDKSKFKNLDSLKFNDKMKLAETSCR